MLFVSHPKILHKHCLQFLLGVKMALREAENNAYVKFWGDKQRALWYVRVFSGVVNTAAARPIAPVQPTRDIFDKGVLSRNFLAKESELRAICITG